MLKWRFKRQDAYNKSITSRGQLDVPRVRLSTYGGRAFCYAGPSAWNVLPDFLNKKAQLTQGLRATAVRVYRHLGFLKFEICTISSAVPENPTQNQIARRSANRLRSYGHFCISKMAVSRHLGFYRIGNSAIRSAFPENPSLEPNVEWIGCTVCEIFAFKLYCDLKTGVRGHSRSSKVTPFDSLHMLSYYHL